MKLLNCQELAEAMGKKPGYVSAMRAAGYQFQFGNQTTLRHALRWRGKNLRFRSTSYYRGHRRPLGGELAVAGDRSGELTHSNGQCNL
jgi:hypothetical protein